MAFLGGFFDTKTKNSGHNQGSTTATFAPGGEKILKDFSSGDATKQVAGNQNVIDVRNAGLTNLQGGANYKPNSVQESTQASIDALRKQSELDTQKQLAEGRSKFYNAPAGRQDINTADTIARNQAAFNSNAANIVNDANKFDVGQQTQAAGLNLSGNTALATLGDKTQENQIAQQQAANDANLRFLSLLRGQETTGSETSRGSSGNAAQAAGQVAGAIAAMMCWVARACFGVDNNKWKDYRTYVLYIAPLWFTLLYLLFGYPFSLLVRMSPKLKRFVRGRMELTLKKHYGEIEFFRHY